MKSGSFFLAHGVCVFDLYVDGVTEDESESEAQVTSSRRQFNISSSLHPTRRRMSLYSLQCLPRVTYLHTHTHTHTHTRLTALFRDYPGEPVPER